MFNLDWFKNILALQRKWTNAFNGNSSLGKLMELATGYSKLWSGGNSLPPVFKSPGLGNGFDNSSFLSTQSIGPAIKKNMTNALFSSILPALFVRFIGFL